MTESETFGSHQVTPVEVLSDALNCARNGEENGFAALWRHHNSRLSRFVQLRLINSSIDSEEVVSETWLNVARDIRKFDGSASDFTSWLYTIARNRIIDAVRIRDRQVRPTEAIEEAYWLSNDENIEEQFDGSEGVRQIVEAIHRLPSAQAEVLLLRIVSDLSVAETAKIVNKNANSVRVLAYRGTQTLKEMLGGEQAHD